MSERAYSVHGLRLHPDVLEAVKHARALSPSAVDALAGALRAQADHAARELVSAQPDAIQTAQGRAQAIAALAALLSNPEPFLSQMRRPS